MSEPQHFSSQTIAETGLRASHFADLVRFAQMVFDPSGGLSVPSIEADWESVGLSEAVANNLKLLGQRYQFESPNIPPDVVWEQLTPASRTWFIANRTVLGDLEETFLARDED